MLAGFQIIGDNLVRTFTSGDRDIVLEVLSHGLNGTLDLVKPVNFDLQKIYSDYGGHWIGGIFDREGNMQKGTFYGEELEKDDVLSSYFMVFFEYLFNEAVKYWKKNHPEKSVKVYKAHAFDIEK